MLNKELIKPYLNLYQTNPCYKNGKKDNFSDTIELTVQLTNKCNANCTFCSNSTFKDYNFNFEFFEEVLHTLMDISYIGKVAFTGGEPTLYPNFVDVVKYVCNLLPSTEIVINSNGSNLDKLEELVGNHIEFGISRHHYDDEKNFEIFKTKKVATTKQLFEFGEKENVLLHCNLIKGYIDNMNEAEKMAEYVYNLGIFRMGFVELLPYTEQAIKDKVDIDILKFPNSIVTRLGERKDICRCANIKYKDILNIYMRYNISMGPKHRSLPNSPFVYNLNHLTHGFGGPLIWECK